MSRGILALVALGFTIAPLRAADPKPQWEIETFPHAKQLQLVRWVGYSPDGTTLLAQVEDEFSREDARYTSRLFSWEVATRKDKLNLKLGLHTYSGGGMYANATTKVGSTLVAGEWAEEIRLADGARGEAKELRKWPVGVWFNLESSDCLWLVERGLDEYAVAYGKMPPIEANPNKKPGSEQWLKTKLTSGFSIGIPVVTANADLTRLALAVRSRKLTLSNIAVADDLTLTEVSAVPSFHKGAVSTMRFNPDGKTLATGSEDSTVCLWDVTKAGKDWKPRATVTTGTCTVAALAFSPDGHTLAVGTLDTKKASLHIVDVPAGKVLTSYRLDRAVTALAYSPDGKTLVTGDSQGRVQTWDAAELRNPN